MQREATEPGYIEITAFGHKLKVLSGLGMCQVTLDIFRV